jgi:hypothetical protein
MSLPEGASAKFGTYMLACRELLSRLPALKLATVGEDRLSEKDCIKRFDETMQNFFSRSVVTDVEKAADRFCDRLESEARDMRDINNGVADIFDEMASAIRAKAPTWDYMADLERFHLQGRELAQSFFSGSTSQITKSRLETICELEIEYSTSAVALSDSCAESFGFRTVPIACYSYQTDQNQSATNIRVRFNFHHDFSLYLSFTFLFLHEYTAHVYSTDCGNERFNDGWMLHAASSFLFREWNQAKKPLEFIGDQAGIFEERLYGVINQIPRRASKFAKDFELIIYRKCPGRFQQMTYELAAFQPKEGENVYWPTQFINALESEFLTKRERLIQKARESADIRDLMTKLPFRS